MTAGELVEHLRAVDPEAIVTIYDGMGDRRVEGPPMVEQFTVSFLLGGPVTEEDVA